MTTLAVIPARLGATRLPRKPLRLIGGAPMIVRVWERVIAMDVADAVVVATDAEEIAAAVRDAGGNAVLTDAAHPSGTDRVAEVASRDEFAAADAIVNVQGDEPFVDEAAVRAALAAVLEDRFDLGTVAAPAPASVLTDPAVVKVVAADDGRALYFSRAAIPHARESSDADDRAALVRQHIGIYAYRREALARWVALPVHPLERVERLEQLRPLAAGIAMGVRLVDAPPARGVDTEPDLAAADRRWRELFAGRS